MECEMHSLFVLSLVFVVLLPISALYAEKVPPFLTDDFSKSKTAITDSSLGQGKALPLNSVTYAVSMDKPGLSGSGSLSFWLKGAHPEKVLKEVLSLTFADKTKEPYQFFNDLNAGYFLLASLHMDQFIGDPLDWHNYTIAWDEDGASFFFDGMLVVERTGKNSWTNIPIKLNIGGDPETVLFNRTDGVSIGYLRIYGSCLSADDVRNIYSTDASYMGQHPVELVPASQPAVTPEAKRDDLHAEKWFNNRIGLDHTIPSPWTPVTASPSSFTCWNRIYKFDALGLTAITSGGKPLIKSPARIFAADETGAQMKAGKRSMPKLISSQPDNAEYEMFGELGELSIRSRVKAEFDGFVWFHIEVKPRKRIVISSLGVEVPMPSALCKYFNSYGSYSSYANSSFRNPDIEGKDYWGRFEPYVWVGDEDNGISLVLESERNCRWADRSRVIGLTKSANGTRKLVLNFINGRTILDPAKIGDNFVYEFAIQATPIRPMFKDYRNIRLMGQEGEPGVGPKNVMIGGIPWFWCRPWPSFREINTDIAEIVKITESAIAKGAVKKGYITPYANFQKYGYRFKDNPIESYGKYHDTWSCYPMTVMDGYWDTENVWSMSMSPCPAASSYGDFFIYEFNEFMSRNPSVNGIYLDETFAWGCRSADHGCAWHTSNGTLMGGYPIFESRELRKRWYKTLHVLRNDSILWSHDSAFTKPAQLAYSDIYSMGETLSYHTEDPLDAVSLAELKTEYLGRQFGVPQFLAPELTRFSLQDQASAARRLMTLMLLHDIQLWNIWADREAVNEVWKLMNDFDLNDDAQFCPYWSSKPLIRSSNASILISTFEKPNGIMVVAYNTSRQAESAEMTLQESVSVRSIHPKGTRISINEKNKLKIDLASRECSIFILDKQDE